MLNAVWVAVIAAVAGWLVLVAAAVFVMLRFARLAADTSEAVTGLAERGDLLAERAHAAIDRADEQLARTDSITTSMDEVTSAMADLSRRVSVLLPAARAITGSLGVPVARMSALAFGVNRALALRRGGPGRGRAARRRQALAGRRGSPGGRPSGPAPGRPELTTGPEQTAGRKRARR